MTVAADFRALMLRAIKHFADSATVTLRKRHSLKKQRTGAPINALLVNGAHTAGASALSLRADLLTGTLPKGSVVTISGTGYTTQASADAVASGVLSLTVSPVLAGNLSDGTAATVTTTFVDYTLTAQAGSVDVTNTENGEVETRRQFFVAYSADVTPEPGDFLVIDSAQQRIADVQEVNAGGGITRWDLTLGSAS